MSFWNWRFPRKKSSRSAQASQRRPQRPRLFRALGELLEQRNLLAVRIWDGLPDVLGASANNQWSTPTNWVGDVAPVQGDDLVFPISASLKTNVNDFASGTLFNSIQFAGSGYDLSGNAIQLLGGLAATNATGSNSLTTPITLLNAETFVSANAGTTLTLGNIDTANLVGTTGVLGTSALTVDGAGDMEISGVLSGQGSLYKQGSGNLVLSNDNTYAGWTTVQQGVINVRSDLALGSTAAGTTVVLGAALQVQGDITVGEPLSIAEAGIGFGDGIDTTHPVGLGALRSISGDNTWTGGIELAGGNNLIGVDAGSLNIASEIGGSQLTARNLYKVGAGTLQFSGSDANTFTGSTTVLQGTLELNKRTNPVDPTTGVLAFQGSLTIGDNLGGDNAAVVRLLADNQIPQLDYFNTTINTVTVNSAGLFDLNDRSDTVGNIVMVEGATFSADITTGTGVLTLGGASLTLNAFQGSGPASAPATITGKFDLGAFLSAAGGGVTKTFAVNNSALASPDQDLVIDADITGSANVSLTKTGAGVLTLSGNNTYHGPTILTGGIVRIGSDTAFGDGLLSIQNNGLVLRAIGAARTVTNTVSLDSNFSVRGSNDLTFTGPATLTGGRTITVLNPVQTTTFSGGIGEGIFGSQNFAKSGEGTLALTGANTYSGTTAVNTDGGTLLLKDGGTLLNSTSVTVSDGGTFKIDNSGSMNLTDRINDLTALTMNGGDFEFVGADGAASSETVGTVTLNGNTSSTIEMTRGTGGGSSTEFIGNSLVASAGATVEFIGEGTALSATGTNRISFANTPVAPTNGILPFARVIGPTGDVDFATYASTAAGISIIPLPSSGYTTDINQAGPTSNVRLGPGVHTLTISRTINSLILDPGAILNGPGATLTVSSGGVMFTGGTTSAINVEALNLGAQAFLVVQGDASTAVINSTVVGAVTSITKAGGGKLIFTGDNQYGGVTNVNGGVLNIQRSTALGGTGGATVVRQGAALEVEETTFGPVNVSIETLTITGTGINGAGALRNVSGANNSWAGNVALTAVAIDEAAIFPSTNVVVASVAIIGVDSGHLNLSGVISGGTELIKVGAGTLETSGILANTYSGSTRIKEGTLLLNKSPGAWAVIANPLFVGDDDGIGAPGVLQLGGSDQILDGVTLQVGSTGQVDFNGFNDAISGLTLTISPNGASSVDLGAGTMTLNGNLTVQQIGTGNPTGATISNGTLALAIYGTTAAANRTFLVNDGATGDDLTITSTIVDGSGIPVPGFGVTKTGFGTMVYGGNSANTYTGTTTVSEGTLALNKGTGSGNVNAFSGLLTVGDANVQSGFARSDVLQLRQPNQIPDWVAAVTVNITGLLDLNGFDETIGNTDGQTALTLNSGNVTTGAGTLTVNGNITFLAAQGATLFTPVVAPTISGKLNLGSVSPIFDIQDQGALTIDAIVSANISSTGAGLVKNNNGFLLLSGNNTYTGDTFVNTASINGIAVGSDTALGTGSVYFLASSTGIMAFGDKRSVSNTLYLSNGRTQFGYWNDLTLNGPANGINGTITATTVNAVSVEFAGGIGETIGGTALTKEGVGKLILSGINTYSGNTIVNANSGIIVLRGQGTALNSGTFTVNVGANLEIDNASGANLSNRIGDLAAITLTGGTLAFIGKAGAASSELVGLITLTGNTASTIQSQTSTVGGSSSILTSTSLTRGGQSYVNLQAFGSDLGSSTNQLRFVAAPTLTGSVGNQILPYATIRSAAGQLDLATHSGNGTSIAAFTNYSIGDINSATPGTNYLLTSNQTLTGNLALNSVLIRGSSLTLDGDDPARTLTLGAAGGAALVNSGAGNLVSVPVVSLAAEGLVRTIGDLEIQSNISGGQALTTAGSGTLKLSGASDSTYTGTTVITEGTLVAQKNAAFGATSGGVVVAFGATLELAGSINVGTETLNIQGTGAASTVSTIGLRSISGNNTWAGNVTLSTNPTGVQVDADSLTLSGIVSGGSGLNKLGDGTLQYSGSSSNTYSGATVIYQGELLLNKTAGLNALAAAVIVGDYVPGAGADQLVLGQSDQIVNTATITVNGTGLFDLNDNSETQAPAASGTILNINVGPTASGEVRIGAGTLTLGTATIQGNVVMGNLAGGSPVAATITSTTGSLVMPTSASAAGTVFTLNDTASAEDLVVSANLSGAGGFTKAGNGRMVLSGDNSYSGITTVTAGRLNLQSDTALGSTAAGTVVTGGALQLQDGRTITGETLTITGTGIAATGALRSLGGVNAWTGNISLTGNTTIGVDADQLTLSGVISSTGAFGVTKILPGTLVYAGLDVPNTYSGNTAVNEGTLELNKTSSGPAANLVAIASPIIDLGNEAGGANADVIRFDNSQQFSVGSPGTELEFAL